MRLPRFPFPLLPFLFGLVILLGGIGGVLGGYTDACNSTEVGNATCGGYNMQMSLVCANASGVYDWNSSMSFCEYGCINGSCVSYTAPCIDYCSFNETKCSGDYVLYCNDTDSDGCYDWTALNRVFCEHGCVDGNCTPYLSVCSSSEYNCEGNYVMNCSQNVDGAWVWVQSGYCEYGCDLVYSSGSVINATCGEVGDAHDVSSSINRGSRQLHFVFEPILIAAYVIGSLLLAGYIGHKLRVMDASVWIFLGLLVAGSVWGVVPLFVTFIVVILSVFLKFKGGVNG